MYECKMLADSRNTANEVRLTTMLVTFPRFILAEFNTHRMLSRNSASSRAIPIARQIQRVKDDPVIPVYWGKNQPGMVAETELTEEERSVAIHRWLKGRDAAVETAQLLMESGTHKQIANRVLEPWLWHTVIVTATEWANFFALRLHKNAQPEFRVTAAMMRDCMDESKPREVPLGGWHLPFDAPSNPSMAERILGSAGRCARVSYLTHDGRRDEEADVKLALTLQKNGHMSPFEHQAQAIFDESWMGNFKGWAQYRKSIVDEAVYKESV